MVTIASDKKLRAASKQLRANNEILAGCIKAASYPAKEDVASL